MQADIDFATGKPANIFDLAGISLTLNSGRIRATSRVEAALGGPAPRQRTSGSIEGDWFIQAGSFAIVNIKSSVLSFDAEGKIHFQVTPAQVVLQPPLDFVSRLLEPFQTVGPLRSASSFGDVPKNDDKHTGLITFNP
jgi:hypothetical protein